MHNKSKKIEGYGGGLISSLPRHFLETT